MSNPDPSPETGQRSEENAPVALLFCTDLFFGVQLQKMAKAAGFRPVNLRPGAPLPPARVLVADLGSRGDWEEALRMAVAQGTVAVAFGPHMETEARRRAKEAGASRVLANSNLARDLPGILLSLRDEGRSTSGAVSGSAEAEREEAEK